MIKYYRNYKLPLTLIAYGRGLKPSSGFTLLELTISLALGLILSISMIQLCSMVKQVIQRQEALLRIQESMQTSIFFMGQAIRSVGNMGCINWQDANTRSIEARLSLEDMGLSGDRVIRVTNKNQLQSNKLIAKNVLMHMKPNTDVLWVISTIPVSEDKKINDIMVLSDCSDIELFTWNEAHKWLRLEKESKYLKKFTSILYYINDKDNLCSVDLNNRNAQSHVEGVQDWKIVLTSQSIEIKFLFAYLTTHLEWEQQWAIG